MVEVKLTAEGKLLNCVGPHYSNQKKNRARRGSNPQPARDLSLKHNVPTSDCEQIARVCKDNLLGCLEGDDHLKAKNRVSDMSDGVKQETERSERGSIQQHIERSKTLAAQRAEVNIRG